MRETLGYGQRVMGVVSFHVSLMPRRPSICGPARRRQCFWCRVVRAARVQKCFSFWRPGGTSVSRRRRLEDMCFATATTQALLQIEKCVSGVCALISRTKKKLVLNTKTMQDSLINAAMADRRTTIIWKNKNGFSRQDY